MIPIVVEHVEMEKLAEVRRERDETWLEEGSGVQMKMELLKGQQESK